MGRGASIRARKWPSLALLALCQIAAMALWFSATAVIPALEAAHGLPAFTQSLFTSAVALGFVAGSLASGMLGLADRLDPRRFIMAAALIASLANAGILLADPGTAAGQAGIVLLRLVTGACMAGIYPVGMKIAASWAVDDMGLLVGFLVGAIVLGTASPHLFNMRWTGWAGATPSRRSPSAPSSASGPWPVCAPTRRPAASRADVGNAALVP